MTRPIRLRRANAYRLTTLELRGSDMDLELRLLSRMGKREARAIARSFLAQIRPWLRHFTRSAIGHSSRGYIGDQRDLSRGIDPLGVQSIGTLTDAVGFRIRMKRLELGMTQSALARAIGLDRSHLSDIERGIHLPNRSSRDRIEQVLKISLH